MKGPARIACPAVVCPLSLKAENVPSICSVVLLDLAAFPADKTLAKSRSPFHHSCMSSLPSFIFEERQRLISRVLIAQAAVSASWFTRTVRASHLVVCESNFHSSHLSYSLFLTRRINLHRVGVEGLVHLRSFGQRGEPHAVRAPALDGFLASFEISALSIAMALTSIRATKLLLFEQYDHDSLTCNFGALFSKNARTPYERSFVVCSSNANRFETKCLRRGWRAPAIPSVPNAWRSAPAGDDFRYSRAR